MPERWTILKLLAWTTERFAERGIDTPRLDAEVLLAHALGVPRIKLYTDFEKPLTDDELVRFRELVRRRQQREPVAYLVGEQEFWSLALRVDPRVLVPRRDTETLVEAAVREARARPVGRVLDVGTGSGAVAVALAREIDGALVVATDASAGALAVAADNVARHGLAGRVVLVRADLVAGLSGPFDLVVSNPPYVPSGELANLQPEVRREPRVALDGGPDGLAVIRRLAPAAAALLAPGGLLAIEHGFDQGERVRAILGDAGLGAVETVSDLAGQDRVTKGRAGEG